MNPDGEIRDCFRNLTYVFEMEETTFFKHYSEKQQENTLIDICIQAQKKVNRLVPEVPFSNIWIAKETADRIPANSVIHFGILNSLRSWNFFETPEDVLCYANTGGFGIDGCLSSFLGQAAATEKPSYLVIGDLAFFYDMNALRLRHIKSNVHILLINNEGGSEFYFNKIWRNDASDLHTTARHKTKAEQWVKENDFIYLKAVDKESLDKALNIFMNDNNEKPVFLEVFTEMRNDSQVLYDFFDLSRPKDPKSEMIRKSKDFLKATVGQEKVNKIKSLVKK